LENHYSYNSDDDATMGYSYVLVFLASHGTDPEYQHSKLVRWICCNRGFFTGACSLQESARRLRHPLFTYGLGTWVKGQGYKTCTTWQRLQKMAEMNMRLMCLDNGPPCRVGWAAFDARLHDEVFLVP
jgi:hypothetical protein